MSEEKRECVVVEYGDKKKGMFVKYAPIKFLDDANQPYTAEQAIVELDNGDVITVDPGCIKFRPKES